ncbi:MAG: hypothetical protein IIB57_10040, partial [Planctomycetes bacterium]|nr:hypothetical protein [Planctomycetota bacterium]
MYSNGMGLARGAANLRGVGIVSFYDYVTVPPFSGIDLSTSVFEPSAAGFDFVDNQGDGLQDDIPNFGVNDFNVESSLEPFQEAGFNKPWDRIVELNSFYIQGVVNLDKVAELVLGGGIFPNAPEYDGIDNDGDRKILASDGIDNDGDLLTDEDPLDNNIDDDGDSIVDEDDEDLVFRAEGIDEGRYRREIGRYVPGSFGSRVGDVVFGQDL